jgi:hypothetical protein
VPEMAGQFGVPESTTARSVLAAEERIEACQEDSFACGFTERPCGRVMAAYASAINLMAAAVSSDFSVRSGLSV